MSTVNSTNNSRLAGNTTNIDQTAENGGTTNITKPFLEKEMEMAKERREGYVKYLIELVGRLIRERLSLESRSLGVFLDIPKTLLSERSIFQRYSKFIDIPEDIYSEEKFEFFNHYHRMMAEMVEKDVKLDIRGYSIKNVRVRFCLEEEFNLPCPLREEDFVFSSKASLYPKKFRILVQFELD